VSGLTHLSQQLQVRVARAQAQVFYFIMLRASVHITKLMLSILHFQLQRHRFSSFPALVSCCILKTICSD